MTNAEILDFINTEVRNEKGTRVTIDSLWKDTNLDSFGHTMVFCALDDKYQYFSKAGYGKNPFAEIPYSTLTVAEVIDTCMLETTPTSSLQ